MVVSVSAQWSYVCTVTMCSLYMFYRPVSAVTLWYCVVIATSLQHDWWHHHNMWKLEPVCHHCVTVPSDLSSSINDIMFWYTEYFHVIFEHLCCCNNFQRRMPYSSFWLTAFTVTVVQCDMIALAYNFQYCNVFCAECRKFPWVMPLYVQDGWWHLLWTYWQLHKSDIYCDT